MIKKVETMEKKEWGPVTYTDENSWSCFMVDDTTIVGYYIGSLTKDSLNRVHSVSSFVGIRPDYRGRGFCREMARFVYDNLIKVTGVDYIVTEVDSNIGASRW
ncbi:acyl-CoA N-acetyltransferase [Cedratvirus kamchatka]|uniref:Acyl-CoA N-acetyltransferase n=1 Tax=Cedratvirus kamchatka TaxID=2716914 RepID=A0A6G8MXI8_9VIRU|nr:acyl-CoA N-acetyltransferase [Cedratvirus kamchatka]